MLSRILLIASFAGTSYAGTPGTDECPCMGTNYQSHNINGTVSTIENGDYPGTYGESCQAHAEPGASDCQTDPPSDWCNSQWCFVDPCFCSGVSDLGESDYFVSPNADGKRLFYSYATCGNADAYNANKCPQLGETNCTEEDECSWSGGSCGATTDNLETSRTSNNCDALDWGTYGSQCRCLGTNKQAKIDAEGGGAAKVTVDKVGISPAAYDWDYGAVCKTHNEPGNADCTKDPPAAWCNNTWCYVDPCSCGGPTDFAISDYFTTTSDSKTLYFSYAACGSVDDYSAAKCVVITSEAACSAEDECVWNGGTCVADGDAVLEAREESGCGSTEGSSGCSCIGSNGQTPVDGSIITDKVGFKDHKYPVDYGTQCTPHAEPGSPGCSGNYPDDWCMNAWCYIDPCNCDDPAVGLSDYFSTTSDGKPLYYSYATCGSADGYNSGKCPAIKAEADCTAASDCTWTGGVCVVEMGGLTAAKTAYVCSDPDPNANLSSIIAETAQTASLGVQTTVGAFTVISVFLSTQA